MKGFRINRDGKELVTDLFSPADFLGYVALLEETTYKDTAEALEETELAVISREDFEELINKTPDVAKKFKQLLAKNISFKEEQLIGLAYDSLRKKVAEVLVLLQKKYKGGTDEKFTINISRENLATIAGTATESVTRTLSDFRREKLIEIESGGIKILNGKKSANLMN